MNKRACLEKVNQLFENRRTANRTEENRRREEIGAIPQIRKKEREQQELHGKLFRLLLDTGDGDEAALLAYRDKSLRLETEIEDLLEQNGYPRDYLHPVHTCPLCADEGAVDGQLCACYKQALSEEYLRQSGMEELFAGCSFAKFDLSLFDEDGRETAKKLLTFAKKYVKDFSPASQNLLFVGDPGCGKTYLTVCIGCELIRSGKFVLYAPVQKLLADFEAETFRKKEATFPTEDYFDADLLIIDDLGTEFYSSFAEAALYNVINTRMTRKKPTVISTNLSIEERAETYADRLNSRLTYSFLNLGFPSCDLRAAQLKRRSQKKNG